MIKNRDYWTDNYYRGYKRPPNDWYHPDMPAKKLCHAFGTFWYQILRDCCVMWKHAAYDYPEGYIVYQRRSKPLNKIVNYKWLLAQKGYDENNSRGWIDDPNNS